MSNAWYFFQIQWLGCVLKPIVKWNAFYVWTEETSCCSCYVESSSCTSQRLCCCSCPLLSAWVYLDIKCVFNSKNSLNVMINFYLLYRRGLLTQPAARTSGITAPLWMEWLNVNLQILEVQWNPTAPCRIILSKAESEIAEWLKTKTYCTCISIKG